MKKCPHCSAEFETQTDLDAHMKAFGTNREEHIFRVRHLSQTEHRDSE